MEKVIMACKVRRLNMLLQYFGISHDPGLKYAQKARLLAESAPQAELHSLLSNPDGIEEKVAARLAALRSARGLGQGRKRKHDNTDIQEAIFRSRIEQGMSAGSSADGGRATVFWPLASLVRGGVLGISWMENMGNRLAVPGEPVPPTKATRLLNSNCQNLSTQLGWRKHSS